MTHVAVVALIVIALVAYDRSEPSLPPIASAPLSEMSAPSSADGTAAAGADPHNPGSPQSPVPAEIDDLPPLGHAPVTPVDEQGHEPADNGGQGLAGTGGTLTETAAAGNGDAVNRQADAAAEGLTPAATTTPNVLRFVYFVEQDAEYDPTAVNKISQQALALQELWYTEFGGTFYLGTDIVDVVYGDHPAEWYNTTPNGEDSRWYRLMNIRAEVRTKLGIEVSANVRLIGYPSTQIDGRVGANRYADAWMDGDDITCIDGSTSTTPYSQDYPAHCLSTVAHELGHVYGLGHQGEEADCMQFGFYHYVSSTDDCTFSPANRQLVVSDPTNEGWLDAVPGDRAPVLP